MQIAPQQIWSFETDLYSDNAIIIHAIEPYGDNLTCVHITIMGNVKISENEVMKLGHMPFELETLKHSLKECLGTTSENQTSFQEGYNYWKDANGGIFTISIHDAIGVIVETAINPD